jgi:hypothetical protein
MMPWFANLASDASGNLRGEEYRRPGDETPRWTVFDPEGAVLGRVTGPPRFQLLDVGADYVLGRRWDDLDVEHVELYPMTVPNRDPRRL